MKIQLWQSSSLTLLSRSWVSHAQICKRIPFKMFTAFVSYAFVLRVRYQIIFSKLTLTYYLPIVRHVFFSLFKFMGRENYTRNFYWSLINNKIRIITSREINGRTKFKVAPKTITSNHDSRWTTFILTQVSSLRLCHFFLCKYFSNVFSCFLSSGNSANTEHVWRFFSFP